MKKLLSIIVAAALLGWLFVLGPLKEVMGPTAATLHSQAADHSQANSEFFKSGMNAQKTVESATAAAHSATGSMQPDATSARERKLASPPRAVDRLPIENNFLHGTNVKGSAVFASLKSNQFGDVMREFERQTSRDPLAAEQTNTYERAIRQEVANAKNAMQLQDFSCGLRICMGSIRSTDQAQFDAWFKEFMASKSLPTYVATSDTVDVGGGNYEHRFLFSIDPTSNGVEPTLPNQH